MLHGFFPAGGTGALHKVEHHIIWKSHNQEIFVILSIDCYREFDSLDTSRSSKWSLTPLPNQSAYMKP